MPGGSEMFYIPAVCALLFYGGIALSGSIGSVAPAAWLFVALLFAAAFTMAKGKWWGCLFGVAVGAKLIQMSTVYTGQVIDIERPMGIALCAFYIICGIFVYRRRRR